MPDVSVSSHAAPDYFPRSLRDKHRVEYEVYTPTSSTPASADIAWEPDLHQYKLRSDNSKLQGGSYDGLPHDFPRKVEGPLAWHGKELHEDQYLLHLTSDHRHELIQAVEHFKGMSITPPSLVHS